jgi:hypothetical protein
LWRNPLGTLVLYGASVIQCTWAARLEELTKTYTSELVISETVAARAGADVSGYPREEITLRNRSTPLAIRVIANARGLAAALTARQE